MATLLPLLLLLLGSAAGNHNSATHFQQLCDLYYPTSDALHPSQCTQPPCNTTNTTLTMVLPFVLSLQERQGQRKTELWLHNTKGGGCGLVWLGLEGQDKVVLEGATCDRPEHKVTVTSSLTSGGKEWVHVVVVMEGQQVRLYTPGDKDTPFTLNCQPSYATVIPHVSRHVYGYSAINTTTTTTQTSTTTTTTTTTQISTTTVQHLLVAINTLVAISVMVSLAMLVLVCWPWLGMEALLEEEAAADPQQ